jgi:hypothetical protein
MVIRQRLAADPPLPLELRQNAERLLRDVEGGT